MKYVQDIEDQASLRALVLQDLKDLGIKPPKSKKKNKDDSLDYGAPGVFGTHLVLVPAVMVEYFGPVPKFLVDACKLLEKHIITEGLFRKSGSVARQKELKQRGETGGDFNDAHPFDVASLVKQFFRELPDPLLTSRLHDTFLKCHQVEPEHARVSAILLLCHLLPWQHLSTLRFTMCFLRKIADKSEHNKMDVPNLAVCLAPNLLHTNSRNDKMNSNESKLLQIQTSIVQYLITNAECIGMVSDSLYERTTLMLSCFASDNELEKSDLGNNESKTSKKKKKRSGSFQGLVSNLSNSFSKWRRDASKGHNQSNMSDKSSMSMISVDKSLAVDGIDGGGLGAGAYYEYDPMSAEATPKLIRKRKADDEGVPFSASKKKAILQNMPLMSTLGSTPFRTPATLRREGGMDLPYPGATPKMKMEQMLLSPNSSTKVKRSSSGKSSCFTPKTPKSNMRRKMKGLLRRLSGGKDGQQMQASPGGLLNSSDVGLRLSGKDIPDYVTIVEPNGQRRGVLMRRHRKTPSSPARLVGSLANGEDGADITPDSSTSSLMSGVSSNPSVTNLRMQPPSGVRSPATSSEISLDDQVPNAGTTTGLNRSGLRRGKPNTMRSGLPSPAKRRSIDQSTNVTGVHRDDDDEECDGGNMLLSTVDTSPIQKVMGSPGDEDMMEGDMNPVMMGDMDSDEEGSSEEEDDDDEDDDDDEEGSSDEEDDEEGEEEENELEMGMSRQTSATSVMSVAESDHDRAFIHESMLADLEDHEPKEKVDSDGFKMPVGFPKTSTAQTGKNVDNSVCSEASDTSTCTVIYNGNPVDKSLQNSGLGQCKSDSKLSSAKSLESIDSAIEDDGRLSKSMSLQSIGSLDSGLGSQKEVTPIASSSHERLSRMPSIRGRPNLQLSSDIQKMLSRAGSVSEEGSAEDDKEALREIVDRHQSPMRFPQSKVRKRGVSPIRIPTIFAKADQEAAQKYRGYGQQALQRSSPKSGSRKPNLPIGTGLVNAVSVQKARCRLMLGEDGNEDQKQQLTPPSEHPPSAGHTPMFPLGQRSTFSLRDSDDIENNSGNSSAAATPKIKPLLMATDVTKRLLSVVPPNPNDTPVRKLARSPIKPVKRLQGSPKSPRQYHSAVSSPGKKVRGDRLSPMPPHMAAEWGV